MKTNMKALEKIATQLALIDTGIAVLVIGAISFFLML